MYSHDLYLSEIHESREYLWIMWSTRWYFILQYK